MLSSKVEIVCSYKEPFKHQLWLRPFLDKEGYELLYFGSEGWTLLIPRCPIHDNETVDDNYEGIIDIPDITTEDTDIGSCGCLN